MDAERKEEILERMKMATSESYETKWENGLAVSKSKEKIAVGKKSRKAGGDFELRVRRDLEEKGWTVAKWPNNIDLEIKKIIPAKRKFNPFSKVMTIGTGFPDFVCFQIVGEKRYNVIGVECKVNGSLSREEKDKCEFLLKGNIFGEIWIARKNDAGKIEYVSFREKFMS